ncbi:MAG: amidohydrolase family protein [Actinomycetia bacterium]|nr:amidohydrolase family protein [Actinomycetes bacterium]
MTRFVLTNGLIFDGRGEPSVGDIAMEDGLVVDVGSGLDGDESIDCTGKLVTPGLFDCHVHFMVDGDFSPNTHADTPFSLRFYLAAERMKRTLLAGVTTVRDAGGSDLGIKEARDLGLIQGPRMQISLTMLSQTGGHGDSWQVSGGHMPGLMDEHPGCPDPIVNGPDEMRKKVRELVRAGADVIKCATSGGVLSTRSNPQHPHFSSDELDTMVAEANAAGLFVMAHAQAAQGIKNAIRAGIRSIEHGIWLDDEAIEMMLEAGTYLVPTLIAPMGVLDAADAGMDLPEPVVNKARAVVRDHRESVGRAIEAGVKIAMGTDSGVSRHGQNMRELGEMAKLGMTPLQVFESSTSIAAELMGIEDEVGTLRPGMAADVVIFSGDDFDVSELGPRVETVIQAGSVVT